MVYKEKGRHNDAGLMRNIMRICVNYGAKGFGLVKKFSEKKLTAWCVSSNAGGISIFWCQ